MLVIMEVSYAGGVESDEISWPLLHMFGTYRICSVGQQIIWNFYAI